MVIIRPRATRMPSIEISGFMVIKYPVRFEDHQEGLLTSLADDCRGTQRQGRRLAIRSGSGHAGRRQALRPQHRARSRERRGGGPKRLCRATPRHGGRCDGYMGVALLGDPPSPGDCLMFDGGILEPVRDVRPLVR
jgi:hypothetical protein